MLLLCLNFSCFHCQFLYGPWAKTGFYIFQIRSVTQSCLTLFDPMNRSTPGLPVHHQLPEFTETHVHRVSDAIRPSHPLSSPSPPAPNPSQHQSLFQWVHFSHESKIKKRSHDAWTVYEIQISVFTDQVCWNTVTVPFGLSVYILLVLLLHHDNRLEKFL